MTGNKPLVVVLGPTAVGKTGLSVKMATRIDGEIISADSRQTYRLMDIGTAKPTPEQRRQVPHHLIDVVAPDENLSVAEYQRLAYEAIRAIHARGHVPILVGGTGQYITATVEGWTIPAVPPSPGLRAELEAVAAEQGVDALAERLRVLDPDAYERIDRRNPRRLIRAIEIVGATGQPLSEARRKQPPPYDVLSIGLTMDRERLYERADRRIDAMMRDGFLEEVRALLAAGYSPDLPSMSGLGYKELAAFLLGEATLEEAITATRRATRDFIRRQYTWFRKHDDGVVWYDVEATPPEAIISVVEQWLEQRD